MYWNNAPVSKTWNKNIELWNTGIPFLVSSWQNVREFFRHISCLSLFFVTSGIWATDHSIFLWSMALMNGLVHQTATLALLTTSTDPTSPSTTTLRCLAGTSQALSTLKQTLKSELKKKQKTNKQSSSPLTQLHSLSASLDELSAPPSLLCTSCACVFHFPPICFPLNSRVCIKGHWNWQPGVFFA